MKLSDIPDIILEDIEDMYTFYVMILGINENIFWDADYSFLIAVVENKTAYDQYHNYIKEKELEKIKNES